MPVPKSKDRLGTNNNTHGACISGQGDSINSLSGNVGTVWHNVSSSKVNYFSGQVDRIESLSGNVRTVGHNYLSS